MLQGAEDSASKPGDTVFGSVYGNGPTPLRHRRAPGAQGAASPEAEPQSRGRQALPGPAEKHCSPLQTFGISNHMRASPAEGQSGISNDVINAR